MSEAVEFGFDDAKVIKHQGIDQFKLSKAGERARVSIVSFKKFHDTILSQKAKEKQAPLTDDERAQYILGTDQKLASRLGKEVKDLTEVDRLDIRSPRFLYAFTHFDKNEGGVGTIRCLSKYEGNNLIKPEICCDKFGDAEQRVGLVVMKYPTDSDVQVELEIFKARKMTEITVWQMTAKRFKALDSAYKDAWNDKRFVIDLRLTCDGDPKFKNYKIEVASSATWGREDMDPAVRHWVLDQGIRAWKHVSNSLGFEMTKEKLLERLGGVSGGSRAQMSSSEAHAESPRLVSYDDLLT